MSTAMIVGTIAAIGAIVAIAGAADAHRLTVPRRPADRRRPSRGDPEGTEFQKRWCSIGKT
jgi:hypothetical protein